MLDNSEVEPDRKDERNESFTKKGPGRRHGSTSLERRKLRLNRRPGVQPVNIKETRVLGYMHAHARRRALKRKNISANQYDDSLMQAHSDEQSASSVANPE